MDVANLSKSKFEQEVLKSEKLVLVDFWADWCGPCKMLNPILEEIAQKYDSRLKIYKVNVDQNQELVAEYQILSIPALLFFKEGKVLRQLAGLRSAEDIRKVIDAQC